LKIFEAKKLVKMTNTQGIRDRILPVFVLKPAEISNLYSSKVSI